MATGAFTALGAQTIAIGTDLVQTSGYTAASDGGQAIYIYDAAVTAAYVTANPVTSKITANGRGFRLSRTQRLNIGMFGGLVGGDLAPAVTTLNSYCRNYTSVAVDVPPGTYRWLSPVWINAAFRLVGGSSGLQGWAWGSVRIGVPPGVTPMIPFRDTNDYAEGGGFEGLNFIADSKLATTGTGTMALDSRTLTLAAAGDFTNSQVICVRGAGELGVLKGSNLLGATTAGSAVITLSGYSTDPGVYPGMVLIIGAAFPAGTRVVSNTGNTITMSANAISTVAAQAISYRADLYAVILSGGGTTALTLSCLASVAVTSAPVIHFDSALHALTGYSAQRSCARGFQGAGFSVFAGGRYSSTSAQVTNANVTYWQDLHNSNCRVGTIVAGTDVNAGTFVNMSSLQPDEYCIVDKTQGNLFVGGHCDGGRGVMVVLDISSTTLDGVYHEGGTTSTLGNNTTGNGFGPLLRDGGARFGPNGGGGLLSPTLSMYPSGGPRQVNIADPNATSGVLLMNIAGGSTNFQVFDSWRTGLIGITDGPGGYTPLAFTMANHPTGAGNVLLQRGVYLGNDTASAGILTMSNYRRHLIGTAAPTVGTWVQGDTVFNQAPAAGGIPGWMCVTGGAPGVWKAMAALAV